MSVDPGRHWLEAGITRLARQRTLERFAREREYGAYSAQAHRLEDDLWEVLVLPL